MAVNPDGTPGPVAPNELIQSAWGNAVVDTLNSRRGCGLYTNTFAVGAGQGLDISWTNESYDTDAYHVSGAVNITIPANRAGIYTAFVYLFTDTNVDQVNDINVVIGGVTYKSFIPIGRNTCVANVTKPLAVGTIIKCQVYNASSISRNYSATIDLNRTALG